MYWISEIPLTEWPCWWSNLILPLSTLSTHFTASSIRASSKEVLIDRRWQRRTWSIPTRRHLLDICWRIEWPRAFFCASNSSIFLTNSLYVLTCSSRSIAHRESSEREGFEPSVPLNGVRVLSRDVPSAAQPSFHERNWRSILCDPPLLSKSRIKLKM